MIEQAHHCSFGLTKTFVSRVRDIGTEQIPVKMCGGFLHRRDRVIHAFLHRYWTNAP